MLGIASRHFWNGGPNLYSIGTQLQYLEHVRNHEELDELFRDILKFHWIDESQHAMGNVAAFVTNLGEAE
jgi:hypothetical protein